MREGRRVYLTRARALAAFEGAGDAKVGGNPSELGYQHLGRYAVCPLTWVMLQGGAANPSVYSRSYSQGVGENRVVRDLPLWAQMFVLKVDASGSDDRSSDWDITGNEAAEILRSV